MAQKSKLEIKIKEEIDRYQYKLELASERLHQLNNEIDTSIAIITVLNNLLDKKE